VIVDSESLALLLFKMTVFLLTAAAVAVALRRASAGARHQVWLAALTGVLALPVLLALAPVRLPVLPEASRLVGARQMIPGQASRATIGPQARRAPTADTVPPVADPGEVGAAKEPGFSWLAAGQVAAWAWAAVAVALIGWLALGRFTVRRLVRSARPFPGTHVRAMLCELADRVGLDRLPALLMSDRTDIPFASGLWRDAVVLPAAATSWDEERLRVVLLHELAHVRRRDLLGHAVGRLACAVYWFHPLVWMAARRLRDESERACDDLVLACGARASDYAGHLLAVVAASRHRSVPAIALPMARRRELEGRVLAILEPRDRRVPGRWRSAAVFGGLGLLFFSVAASAPSQPATPPPPADTPRPAAAAVATPAAPAPRPVVAAAVAVTREAPPASAEAQSPEKRELLARILRTDPDAQVRKAAAWALAEATEPAAVSALVAALGDDEEDVREMAAWALSGSPRDDVSSALATALREDQSTKVRKTAAWALGQRRQGDAAALVAAMSDLDPDVRETAIWAVGQYRVDSAPPAMVEALGDGDVDVRRTAAWALGEVGDPATAAAVKAAFANEKDAEVRTALFRTLVLLGDASREVMEQALSSQDSELRSRAVRVMAGGGPGGWPWPRPRPKPRPNP